MEDRARDVVAQSQGHPEADKLPEAVGFRRRVGSRLSLSQGWQRIAFAAAIVSVAALVLWIVPRSGALRAVIEWTQAQGVVGIVGFGMVYALAAILMVPGAILTLAAGLIFGPFGGFAVVSPASTLGALASFLIGRFVARSWVVDRLQGHAQFAALDVALGAQGFKVVVLLRLSPVLPFGLLNYALGLTRIRWRSYTAASWLGMIPGTLLYTYLGSTLATLDELLAGTNERSPAEVALFVGGLVATVAVSLFIARLARQALKVAHV